MTEETAEIFTFKPPQDVGARTTSPLWLRTSEMDSHSSHSCSKCTDLRGIIEIRTPGEMTKALRVIRANLADKTIKDITRPAHCPSRSFSELSEKGPWPDYIEHYFECISCGAKFRLVADTYHGAGGRWEGGRDGGSYARNT